jgi:hypothetical protein|tara:strand:- start:14028 stop:14198 length:171 start_codon:yes stop_codon:yes gene_type:complete
MSNKKIKLIKEDETSADDLLKTMLKTMEAMDWKLWELYQTAQRVEKYLGIEKEDEK